MSYVGSTRHRTLYHTGYLRFSKSVDLSSVLGSVGRAGQGSAGAPRRPVAAGPGRAGDSPSLRPHPHCAGRPPPGPSQDLEQRGEQGGRPSPGYLSGPLRDRGQTDGRTVSTYYLSGPAWAAAPRAPRRSVALTQPPTPHPQSIARSAAEHSRLSTNTIPEANHRANQHKACAATNGSAAFKQPAGSAARDWPRRRRVARADDVTRGCFQGVSARGRVAAKCRAARRGLRLLIFSVPSGWAFDPLWPSGPLAFGGSLVSRAGASVKRRGGRGEATGPDACSTPG